MATKSQAKSKYQEYLKSTATSLYDVYETFSPRKAEAWQYCVDFMRKKEGHGLRVLSANTYMFTAGFEFEENGTKKFMYITPSSDVEVEV